MPEGNNIMSEAVKVEGIEVVSAELEGEKLIVIVESNSISKLIDGPARKLAYDARLKHGLIQAGIEAVGGTYVPEKELRAAKKKKRPVALWRAEFRLTPMI